MDNKYIEFIKAHIGAAIGLCAGIILAIFGLNFIFAIIVIVACTYAGMYVQKNKNIVKEKLKSFIDKI